MGTTNEVSLVAYGSKGKSESVILADNPNKQHFQPSQTDEFKVKMPTSSWVHSLFYSLVAWNIMSTLDRCIWAPAGISESCTKFALVTAIKTQIQDGLWKRYGTISQLCLLLCITSLLEKGLV